MTHAHGGVRRRRALVGAWVVSALVLAACGSSDDDGSATTTTAPRATTSTVAGDPSTTTTAPGGEVIEITVADGRVEGGVQDAEVGVGDEVTIRVTADVTEEVHVHGYDLTADLSPGVPGEVTFVADIPGVFEVELEHSGLEILSLRVS